MADVLGISPIARSHALRANLAFPNSAVQISDGSIVIADTQHSVIKRVQDGFVTVIAGTGIQGSGMNELNMPTYALEDADGTLIILDAGNKRILRRAPDGSLSVVAQVSGYLQSAKLRGTSLFVAVNNPDNSTAQIMLLEGGQLTNYLPDIPLTEVTGFDVSGSTTWVMDGGNFGAALYQITAGLKTKVADLANYSEGVLAESDSSAFVGNGQGILHYSDGVSQNSGDFTHVADLNYDNSGRILATDSDARSVEYFDPTTGKLSYVCAGGGLAFSTPVALARLDDTHLAVLETGSYSLYSYDVATRFAVRLVGNGFRGYAIEGVLGTETEMLDPQGLTVNDTGIFWIESGAVFAYDKNTKLISVYAGQRFKAGYSDNTDRLSATFAAPSGLATDADGSILVVDSGNNAIRRVDSATGLITTVASADYPSSVVAFNGGYLVSEYHFNDIVFCREGTCSPYAGVRLDSQPFQGYGDFADGDLLSAKFNSPSSLWYTGKDIIVSDQFNNRIRRITQTTVETLAGDGSAGYGPGQLNLPGAAAFLNGQVFIADTGNGLVRSISLR